MFEFSACRSMPKEPSPLPSLCTHTRTAPSPHGVHLRLTRAARERYHLILVLGSPFHSRRPVWHAQHRQTSERRTLCEHLSNHVGGHVSLDHVALDDRRM